MMWAALWWSGSHCHHTARRGRIRFPVFVHSPCGSVDSLRVLHLPPTVQWHASCLLPTMPCWCSAHSSSLPPSAWWIMEVWIVVHAYYQLFILCHTHWMYLNSNVSFCTYDIYCFCPSRKRNPPLLLSWRFLHFIFPRERSFSMWGSGTI